MGIRYYFNSIYLNKHCIIFPLMQLVVIFCLVIYLIINRNNDLILQITESLLTCIFFFELLVKIFIQKENYLQNNNNLTDLILFTTIISLMVIQKTISINLKQEQEEELISIALLFIRYAVQSVRLYMNIKINRQTIAFIQNNDISFTNEQQIQSAIEVNQQ
ncbi:unnamed protein product [Paramecium primaurelia]|uniref:Transmembrane protein n=2 Tax=Paramecium TaxID=5884 RepID=A0A8S1SNZ9_9CILI|nr:unnamed protein product [Paramecium primaurelia]CAD8141648.1 unnamed protein product [Paramecium pentaurelia]CAD8141650.1 unnamed protein product [Paramecium pentaurelia]